MLELTAYPPWPQPCLPARRANGSPEGCSLPTGSQNSPPPQGQVGLKESLWPCPVPWQVYKTPLRLTKHQQCQHAHTPIQARSYQLLLHQLHLKQPETFQALSLTISCQPTGAKAERLPAGVTIGGHPSWQLTPGSRDRKADTPKDNRTMGQTAGKNSQHSGVFT